MNFLQRDKAYRLLREFVEQVTTQEAGIYSERHYEDVDCINCGEVFSTVIKCDNEPPQLVPTVDSNFRFNAANLLEKLEELLEKE